MRSGLAVSVKAAFSAASPRPSSSRRTRNEVAAALSGLWPSSGEGIDVPSAPGSTGAANATVVRSQGRERRSRITLPETFEGTKDEPRLQVLVGEPPAHREKPGLFLPEGQPRLHGDGPVHAGPGTQEATNGVRSAPAISAAPLSITSSSALREKGSDVVTRTPPISPGRSG